MSYHQYYLERPGGLRVLCQKAMQSADAAARTSNVMIVEMHAGGAARHIAAALESLSRGEANNMIARHLNSASGLLKIADRFAGVNPHMHQARRSLDAALKILIEQAQAASRMTL